MPIARQPSPITPVKWSRAMGEKALWRGAAGPVRRKAGPIARLAAEAQRRHRLARFFRQRAGTPPCCSNPRAGGAHQPLSDVSKATRMLAEARRRRRVAARRIGEPGVARTNLSSANSSNRTIGRLASGWLGATIATRSTTAKSGSATRNSTGPCHPRARPGPRRCGRPLAPRSGWGWFPPAAASTPG